MPLEDGLISGSQVCDDLDITDRWRTVLVRKGLLPKPLYIGRRCYWRRADYYRAREALIRNTPLGVPESRS